jgi:hypothetical protein
MESADRLVATVEYCFARSPGGLFWGDGKERWVSAVFVDFGRDRSPTSGLPLRAAS